MASAHTFVDLKQPVFPLPDSVRGGVVAIGNFDGMHKGHQAVLEDALVEARKLGVKAIMLTFEPHPRSVFRPDNPVFRLTPHDEKALLAEALGFDGMISLHFTKEFASQSAESFIEDMLIKALDAREVISGYDFHFGKDRKGSPDFLREQGHKHGFGVKIVDMKADRTGDAVSSTRIRQALEDGATHPANRLLGYRYFFTSTVVHGEKNGRKLGYPTANLKLADNSRLKEGVYAVRLMRSNGQVHDGVASYGRRPTFDNGAPIFEVHVFDFEDDLYDESVRVALYHYLRGEEKFDSLDTLILQMDEDSAQARAILSDAAALSPLETTLWGGISND
ncbi:bifunctional riboflavin kinase/FAD synthetase [Cohaesibacter gelatinilyticus]|uniref:Riboflavin biosynthesis protein n=1 Tax=Cohaesibacter gelatinilyticus TaxID=372072 RepID=A0A285NAN3_9HYPH|nr:bifunctional riboflavin kinase/FAD synthetase [Cohaesibacter gelatinilyticus]SNZ05987.1 FMN adenylyltransferase /riboflavin kinase [Cohaesibacter gelatinilyticus]